MLLAACAAEAANIEVRQGGGRHSGRCRRWTSSSATSNLFAARLRPSPKASVAFRSDGGSLLAGIRIGMLIRVRNFTTIVPDAAQVRVGLCGGLARGRPPLPGSGASKVRVSCRLCAKGRRDGRKRPRPMRYWAPIWTKSVCLKDAIVYITQAAPNSMKWLNMEEAAQHGIDVALLPAPDAAPTTDASFWLQAAQGPETAADQPRRACD